MSRAITHRVTLADIHHGSGVPIILIDERLLPQKIQVWERVHGRVLDWLEARQGDLADIRVLAKRYAPGVAIDAALLEQLLRFSGGSLRRICVNLDRIREHSVVSGLTKITVDDYSPQLFSTGEAPTIAVPSIPVRARA